MWTKRSLSRADRSAVPARRYRQRPTVTSIDHGAVTILLDSRSEQFYSLDETGRQIWALMATPRTEGEIVDSIVSRFGVSAEQVTSDVSEFLSELEQIRLIDAT